jgi:ankyrin repeat protein
MWGVLWTIWVITEDGKTPQHKAKDEHLARLLISHGADVHAVDNAGKTPVPFARALGNAKALIEHGADVKALLATTNERYVP